MGILSTFTGTDEDPLSEGGNWALTDTVETALKRISNQVSAQTGVFSNGYWTPSYFGPDLSVYATIAVAVSGGVTVALQARIKDEGGANTHDGYSLTLSATHFQLYRITDGVYGELATPVAQTHSAGDKFRLTCVGDLIKGWINTGSGWTLVISALDGTYSDAGRVGIRMLFDTVRLDDFGANNISRKPHFSRRISVAR